jgi:hypothetical protein
MLLPVDAMLRLTMSLPVDSRIHDCQMSLPVDARIHDCQMSLPVDAMIHDCQNPLRHGVFEKFLPEIFFFYVYQASIMLEAERYECGRNTRG